MRWRWVVGLTMLNLLGCAALKPPAPTAVSFHSTPPGAEVQVDGVSLGTTPMTHALSCTTPRTVVFTLPGYAAVSQALATVPGWDGTAGMVWPVERCTPLVAVQFTR